MKQRFGRIINFSSVVGILGNPGQANYVAKIGCDWIYQDHCEGTCSREITVNAVAPGFITTEMTDKLTEDIVKEKLNKQIPLRRLGEPKDIAKCPVHS